MDATHKGPASDPWEIGAARRGANGQADEVRIDFVPARHYCSREFLELEKERMWPRVWQIACREEELPRTGSYVTFDIMDESIAVVRVSDKEIKAFHNVCQHRGRRLTEGVGQMARFNCRFHGWQYNLDGSLAFVLDREDWAGCPNFRDGDLHLKEVHVRTWGGFVFINMDPDPEPFETYMEPVTRILGPYELEKMRFRWYVSAKVPCNWKVALEAFNEAYHVYATHPQLMKGYGDDRIRTKTFGRHGMFAPIENPASPPGAPSPRTGLPMPEDYREGLIEYVTLIDETLKAVYTPRDAETARRLRTEVDKDAPPQVVLMKLLEMQREAAIASGAGWPDITMEQMMEAGSDWHIFPNFVILPYPDGALAYRSIPDEEDPAQCIFEVYSLQRYAPGAEPRLERTLLYGDGEWRDIAKFSEILAQDFSNMSAVQRGMKSRGFSGARTNPLQESTVPNFHRAILDYIEGTPPSAGKD